jgi:Flp pilus assembly protein TadG
MLIRANTIIARNVRRGAHLLEFAIVVPIFFVFVLALVEFGRGLMTSSLVSNGARVGCRTGVMPGKQNTDVTAAVDNLMQGQGISGYTTAIQVNGQSLDVNGKPVDVSKAQSGDTITVQVSVPIASVSWVPSLSFLAGNLNGQFSMPHE